MSKQEKCCELQGVPNDCLSLCNPNASPDMNPDKREKCMETYSDVMFECMKGAGKLTHSGLFMQEEI